MDLLHFESIKNGVIFDVSKSAYPCISYGHSMGETKYGNSTSFYLGFVLSGELNLQSVSTKKIWLLLTGMFFATSDPFVLAGNGSAFIIERLGYRGITTIGGPVESVGRLSYIDSCSTTILVNPIRQGDPCLNFLHFPKNVKQRGHHHPTIRLGCVFSGSGFALDGDGNKTQLLTGGVFLINPMSTHHFETKDEVLNIIAFHPETDWGPLDQSHPMINRTYSN
jgi:hypothetical protein